MPSHIPSIYQQYKRDTAKLGSWLAETALNYGYSTAAFELSSESDDTPQKTAQQVKNAKKKAKQKAKAKGGAGETEGTETTVGPVTDTAADTLPTGTYRLKIPQYTEIATFVAEQGIVIPIELMRLVRRIISAREEVMSRYAHNGNTESNEGHKHFLDTMDKVETILRDSLFGESSDKETFNRLVAKFAELQNSSGKDQGVDEPDIDLPEAPHPSGSLARPKRTFVPESTRDEAFFQILAFLDDFHGVQTYIVETWNAYLNEEIDLITASVTTNTALELLRGPHDDLVKNAIPQFNGLSIGQILSVMLITVYAGQSGSLRPHLPTFDKLGPEAHHMKYLYGAFLIPNLQILSGMGAVIKDGYLPLYRPGFLGTFDPTFGIDYNTDSAHVQVDFQIQWQNAKVLLCETYVEYMMLLTAGKSMAPKLSEPGSGSGASEDDNVFFMDEMAVEMAEFVKTKEPTLLLLMHSQVFIDVNMGMQKTTSRANKELRKGLSDMLDTLRRRFLYESSIPPATWPEQNEKTMERLRGDIEYWRKVDPIQIVKKNLHGAAGNTPSSFFDRAPILCGLILFRFRLIYQEVSFTLANAWGMILSSAHLYVACQLYNKLPGVSSSRLKSWPDMDLVMRLHGKEDIFAGKVPGTVEDANNSFLTMMGYSSEAGGPSRNPTSDGQPRPVEAESGAKGMVDHTVILPMFKARYHSNKRASTRLDVSLVQTLLKDIRSSPNNSNGQPLKFRRERRHRSPKFSTVQLLAIVENGLRLETTSLRFDYISMHLRCIQVLKKIRSASHEYLSRKIGPKYIENESQLPYVIGYILNWATMSGKVAASLGVKNDSSKEVASKLLLGAAKALNDFVTDEKESSVEVKRVSKVRI